MPDFLKTLLLLQFLFDHSEIFTGETRYIVPCYNKARNSNFCLNFQKLQKYCRITDFFKTLLLLQFLFNHSEIFTGESRHIVSVCNKARISNFCLEFQKLQKFQISSKHYPSFSSYSIILKFLLEKLDIQCHPITKAEFQIPACNSRNCRNIAEITDFFQTLLLLQFLFNHSEIFTGETRHIVSPCNKARISNFCLEFQKLQKLQISLKCYSSFSSYSIILNFLLEKLGIQCHPITKPEFQIFSAQNFRNCRNYSFFQNATLPSVLIQSF